MIDLYYNLQLNAGTLVAGLEAEVRTLQRKLARRDNEIVRQERELHKLRVRDLSTEYFCTMYY